jgi:hypothetical protein
VSSGRSALWRLAICSTIAPVSKSFTKPSIARSITDYTLRTSTSAGISRKNAPNTRSA